MAACMHRGMVACHACMHEAVGRGRARLRHPRDAVAAGGGVAAERDSRAVRGGGAGTCRDPRGRGQMPAGRAPRCRRRWVSPVSGLRWALLVGGLRWVCPLHLPSDNQRGASESSMGCFSALQRVFVYCSGLCFAESSEETFSSVTDGSVRRRL
eukprot:366466-Chlamydomonas_euryale.AAC.23